ncbi:Putative Clr5 domain-containing protein [Colletotrichum destructivum]|uniref:Clr5 domain-containing protein n=1 Tax=Colletotrichum destructivum TaxID=34406 RepID=A0AAX4IV11_9PEZI|nr:Putative Clr5 domain-containing protein [Colletotrichum destructivum]
MVYDWEAHEKLCFQLYINDKKSLEDIMDYLKIHHNFAPCKRAFQTQFRKWDFPSKQNPAYKNDRLVARVKELWERNLSQKDMLTVLKEDGFDIKKRELIRLRTKNRWLLKAANGERPRDSSDPDPDPDPQPPLMADDAFEGRNNGRRLSNGAGDMTPDTLTDHELLGTLPNEVGTAWDQDNNNNNNRRKRRRLKAWEAASSQDAPLAPRFPSETTLDEAKAILSLANDVYRQVRTTFARLCEESNIVKKTVAGPDRWETVKDRLVQETPQLQEVMWQSRENHESKTLALDVICTDITKRVRTLDKRITLAEAKNTIGVNPEEARDLRAAFDRILRDEGLSSKSEAGPAQWSDLKRRWEDGSALIQRILALGTDDPAYAQKVRALDLIARDVMKRLRDDISRKDQPRKRSPTKAPRQSNNESQHEQNAEAAQPIQPDMVDGLQHPTDLSRQYGNAGQVSSMGLVSGSGDSQAQLLIPVSMQAQANTDPMAHSAARMLSSALLGQANMTLESHMGSSLLLAANAQAAFVGQQYAQQFTAAQPVFHTPAPASVAVYLRLHPSSTFVVNVNLWIATLSSHSVQDLRHVAASKFPGSICLRLEGVLKDGKGGEMPLQIDQDPELAAYLAHLQGATPTFNVQLVPGWKAG